MVSYTRRTTILALAVALDRALCDPPTAIHPVGWMGRAARLLERRAPEGRDDRLRYGALMAGVLPASAGAAYWLVGRAARRSPAPLGLIAEAGLLSTTIALRSLLERAREVGDALEGGDLDHARSLAGHHLVSRDTSALAPHEVAGAAIESVAENFSDGFAAPLLAYALGGLPAAAAYRAANTLDSLWGYRSEEYEALGRHAARLDDALNLVPSRLSAATLVVATLLRDGPGAARRAFDTWFLEGDFTPSPNAGQPMGAMAGALGVELEKREEYRLGGGTRHPGAADIEDASDLVRDASTLLVAGLVALLLSRAVAGRVTR